MRKAFQFIFLGLFFSLNAQNISVKGNVVDEFKEPIYGASIILKNTTKGTTTDENGNFEITASKNEVLQFSFLGFKTQEIIIKNASFITIQLQPESQELKEIVVVSSVSKVKSGLEKTTYEVKSNTSTIGGTGLDVLRNLPSVSIDAQNMLNIMFNDVFNSKNEYLNRYNSGLPIKWVELGNELYLNENQVGPYVSNIASYISHSQQIVSEIKTVNPNAKLAVCLEKDDFNVGEWNHILSQNQTYFDAATLHNYIAINHHFYSKYVSYGMLSSYKTSLNRFNQYNQLFPSKPLLLTEWGITGNVDQPYFLETIGIADAFLAIEKANELNIVKQAGIHMLYKNNANSSPTLMYYDNSNNLRLTSKGVLYSKLFEVFKNAEVYNAETISAELSPGLKSVNAKMVKNGNQYKIFAVNKLPVDSPFHLEVDGNIFNGNYTIETLVDDMSNPTNGFLAATNSWSNSNGSGSIILPASSISIINIDEGEIQNLNSGIFSSSSLNVFPNPTSNILQLYDENNSKDLLVSLFDVSGKLINDNLFKNQKSISIESLEKGLYFLKIYKNEILIAIKKVIKN